MIKFVKLVVSISKMICHKTWKKMNNKMKKKMSNKMIKKTSNMIWKQMRKEKSLTVKQNMSKYMTQKKISQILYLNNLLKNINIYVFRIKIAAFYLFNKFCANVCNYKYVNNVPPKNKNPELIFWTKSTKKDKPECTKNSVLRK